MKPLILAKVRNSGFTAKLLDLWASVGSQAQTVHVVRMAMYLQIVNIWRHRMAVSSRIAASAKGCKCHMPQLPQVMPNSGSDTLWPCQ